MFGGVGMICGKISGGEEESLAVVDFGWDIVVTLNSEIDSPTVVIGTR